MNKIIKKVFSILAQRLWLISLFLIIAVNVYWGVVATDRYVSKSYVVLQSPDIAPPDFSFSAMISGGSSNDTADLLLLREYLMSMDMLKKLDDELNLRRHFSNNNIDYLSRLRDMDLPVEHFHDYYLERINIRLDDYSGVLIVEASVFEAEMAKKIVARLLQYGEKHMNEMGQRLASEQVAFIESQVEALRTRLIEANKSVLDYQNKEGMISPSDMAMNMGVIIAQLSSELVTLKAKRSVLRSYQSTNSPEVVNIESQIRSLEQQIQKEQSKLTSHKGDALNKVSLEYEGLKLQAQFAQELYANSLATLEATRVEAARKLKQVSVISAPNLPEYAIEPNRSYLMALYTIVILIISLLIGMIVTVVNDHKD